MTSGIFVITSLIDDGQCQFTIRTNHIFVKFDQEWSHPGALLIFQIRWNETKLFWNFYKSGWRSNEYSHPRRARAKRWSLDIRYRSSYVRRPNKIVGRSDGKQTTRITNDMGFGSSLTMMGQNVLTSPMKMAKKLVKNGSVLPTEVGDLTLSNF